jgi:D-alanyl-D-alanine carboxypeptidase (penicillin-binding protein 5/6)
MIAKARRVIADLMFASAACLMIVLCAMSPITTAQAQGLFGHSLFSQPKYAAIVVDANTGEVLYALHADAPRYPASITKVLTLYLTFEALSTGRLSLNDHIVISPHAFSMIPSKISTRPGESLTVAQAIPAMTVHSANDVAVAMAEKIAGSEARFAQLMTTRAHELGMVNSQFVNASGVPMRVRFGYTQNVSSARDVAILARAIMRDYPQYYAYFSVKEFTYNGKVMLAHNHLLTRMPGVDGLKTGFTNAAGFNLAASAVRDGRRLIAVVLGGTSTAARDENVESLLNAGFNVEKRHAHGDNIKLASIISEPEDTGPIVRPPIEQGSGDQPDLRVVVQPQLRTLPMMTAATALTAKGGEVEPADSGKAVAVATPVIPCKTVRLRHSRRVHTICPTGRRLGEAVAQAARDLPCPTHHGHSHIGCAKAAEVAKADLRERTHAPIESDKTAANGRFMIQVGAYKNAEQAKDHMQKVAGDFSPIVGAASAKVEKAGGNYRVRFRGLNETQAKAACHALTAKGQVCMVMGAS